VPSRRSYLIPPRSPAPVNPAADAAGSPRCSLRLHALDQDARRLGAHDALVGQLAGAQRLAEVAAADRDLLLSLRPVLVDQPDAAQLLVVGREADLHRLD